MGYFRGKKNPLIMKERFKVAEAREIGNQLGIDWGEVDLDEFTIGINVELEHGSRYAETNVSDDDPFMTGKIAWAHLKEFKDYYTRLSAMEKEAEQYWNSQMISNS